MIEGTYKSIAEQNINQNRKLKRIVKTCVNQTYMCLGRTDKGELAWIHTCVRVPTCVYILARNKEATLVWRDSTGGKVGRKKPCKRRCPNKRVAGHLAKNYK